MKSSTKQANKCSQRLLGSLTPQLGRLARTIEWINASRTLKGEFGVFGLCDRMAVIISKTYAECGDAATLPDDVAIMMLKDLLLALDENIIERNKHKKLLTRRSRGNGHRPKLNTNWRPLL